MKTLDVEAVQAFVLAADLNSFTRAAEALDTTQSAVSLKIKRLEDGLGRRLLERTPRLVRLSAEGSAFLPAARQLVAAHQSAIGAFAVEHRRLTVGISQHIVGAGLPALLKRMNASDPGLVIGLHIDTSRTVLEAFDAGELDAAIALREPRRRDGEVLVRGAVRLDGGAGFQSSARRAAAAGNPGRALQRARHGGRCAGSRRHPLDRSVCRRWRRDHWRRAVRGPRGRRAGAPGGASRTPSISGRGSACRRCRPGRWCSTQNLRMRGRAGRCARSARPSRRLPDSIGIRF